MQSHFIAVVLGTTLCAILCACNDGTTVAKSALATAPDGSASGTHTGGTPGTTPGTPPPANPPQPSRIETFAQSLDSFSFDFNRTSRKVAITFARLSPEGADTAGMPTLEPAQEFVGEIPHGAVSAALVPRAAGNSDYAVRVDCADETCLSATIQIDRLRGALAGRAVLSRVSREMNAQLNRNIPNGRLTTSSDPLTSALAELANRDNLGSIVTASVTQVENGRHDWFDIRYEFLPQPHMRADQPGYFDDKTVVISGELGTHQLAKITRSVSYRDNQVTTNASVYAAVKQRQSPFALSVTLEKTELRNPSLTVSQAMGDPLSF